MVLHSHLIFIVAIQFIFYSLSLCIIVVFLFNPSICLNDICFNSLNFYAYTCTTLMSIAR